MYIAGLHTEVTRRSCLLVLVAEFKILIWKLSNMLLCCAEICNWQSNFSWIKIVDIFIVSYNAKFHISSYSTFSINIFSLVWTSYYFVAYFNYSLRHVVFMAPFFVSVCVSASVRACMHECIDMCVCTLMHHLWI